MNYINSEHQTNVGLADKYYHEEMMLAESRATSTNSEETIAGQQRWMNHAHQQFEAREAILVRVESSANTFYRKLEESYEDTKSTAGEYQQFYDSHRFQLQAIKDECLRSEALRARGDLQ